LRKLYDWNVRFNKKEVKLEIEKWECISEYVDAMRKTIHMEWGAYRKTRGAQGKCIIT